LNDRDTILNRLLWNAVGFFGSLVLRLLFITLRIREVGLDNLARARKSGPGPVLYAIWHGRLLGNCYINRNQGICVMISRHRDGEIIARIVENLGFLTARGSATHGAASALKFMLEVVNDKHDLGLTVDGPRGPALKAKPGAVYAASRSGCPVIPLTVGYSSSWIMSSWDRFRIPKPFSSMVVVYGTPISIPQDVEENAIGNWCAAIEKGNNRISALADNLACPIEYQERSRITVQVEKFLTRERDCLRYFPLLAILFPFELIYRLLWFVRETFYELKVFRSRPSPVPAVCSGSLSLGGAGKTPLAILLADKLAARGLNVGVVTRGYRSRSRNDNRPLLIDPGESGLTGLKELSILAGDEAALMSRKLKNAVLAVFPDRLTAAQALVEKSGVEVLVMDDGFGHRKFGRDMDLLLLSESFLRMTGHVLPAGYLREPRRAARRARAIVIAGAGGPPESQPVPWAAGKEIIYLRKKAGQLTNLACWLSGAPGWESPLDPGETLKGKKILAFCSIAQPESFRDLLAGFDPAHLKLVAFPDHFPYDNRIQEILVRRAGAEGAILVTTEKDAVKLDPELIGQDCLVLGLELEEFNPGSLDRLLDELLAGGRKRKP